MAQRAARIVRSDDILHGEPRIEDRRVSVRQIRALVEINDLPAEEVANRLDLGVADVYAALTYYHEHPEEMAEVEAERERRVDASTESSPSLEDLQNGSKDD